MDYQTATESTVSLRKALKELKRHSFYVDFDESTGKIFDAVTGDTIAMPVDESDAIYGGLEYDGADILNWLGY